VVDVVVDAAMAIGAVERVAAVRGVREIVEVARKVVKVAL
jgi:hypothetical protein